MAEEQPSVPLDYRGPPPGCGPEEGRWWWWRFAYRAGVVLYFFLVAFVVGPAVFFMAIQPTMKDFLPVAARCVPLVRAAKEFQRDHGRLPSSDSELVPRYLPEKATMIGCWISWGYKDKVAFRARYGHQITYTTTPGSEGWEIRGPYVNGPLPLPPVTIGPATAPGTAPAGPR